MRHEDIAVLGRNWNEWRWGISSLEPRVAALSPDGWERMLLKKFFPTGDVERLYKPDRITSEVIGHAFNGWKMGLPWDLNSSCDYGVFDLITACNIFMYSNDPELWLNNIFKACKKFWMQDLISGKRDDNGYLGGDGDSQRYSFPSDPSDFVGAFDMSPYMDRLTHFESYDVGPNSTHFVAEFNGDIL